MRKTYLGLGLLGLGAVFLIAYYSLGGFEKLVFETKTRSSDYRVLGILFEGRYSDPSLEQNFYRVKEIMQSGAVSGTLVIINYDASSENTKKGMLKQLIGILPDKVESVSTLPDGLEWHTIPAQKIVKTVINSHNLVMPKPNEVVESAEEYAKTKGLQLQHITIEKYVSDRELVVEIPIE